MAEAARDRDWVVSFLVPHHQASVGLARRHLAVELLRAGLPPPVSADALLVLSELMSNAVRHADPLPPRDVRVSWRITPALVEIMVTDGGSSTVPVANAAAMSAQGGRGLNIVRQVTAAWGVSSGEDGVTVWGTVPLTSAAARA